MPNPGSDRPSEMHSQAAIVVAFVRAPLTHIHPMLERLQASGSAAEALNTSAKRVSPILVFTSIYRPTLAGPPVIVLLAGVAI